MEDHGQGLSLLPVLAPAFDWPLDHHQSWPTVPSSWALGRGSPHLCSLLSVPSSSAQRHEETYSGQLARAIQDSLSLTCHSQGRNRAQALSSYESIEQKLIFPAGLQALYGDLPLVSSHGHCLGLPICVPVLDHKGVNGALGHRP